MFAHSDGRLLKKGCVETPYMEKAWACFTTNLRHVVAHLENSKFMNLRIRLKTSSSPKFPCASKDK